MRERLLVVRGGALGDFVLGLPALRALREAFPASSLELIAPAAVLPLATHLADTATPLERGEIAALFADAPDLPKEVLARYRDLDLVVLWLADREGSVRRNLERLRVRRLLWAPALPEKPGRHAADHLLDTLEPLGITGDEAVPRLSPTAPALRKAAAAQRQLGIDAPVVAIHPGSGGSWKLWPAERFARVADHLAAAGFRVVLIQGPADAEVVRQVLASVRTSRPGVVSGLPVEELAAILALCTSCLGNDSGVTHLAAAVGTPTVAIFGPTDAAVWGPRGQRVVVLRGQQECSPCSRAAAADCRTRACLEGVDVEQVLEALERLLVAGPPTRG